MGPAAKVYWKNLLLERDSGAFRYRLVGHETGRDGTSDKKTTGLPPADLGMLKSALDNLGTSVLICDHNGRLCYFNQEAERILGTGLREPGLGGWAATDGCYLPDRRTPYPRAQLPLRRAARGEAVDDELLFIRNRSRPDGEWVSVNGRPFRDEAGAHRGAAVEIRNVTEAMAALTGGRNSNPAFEQTTGYGAEEVLGRPPRVMKSGRHDGRFYSQMWDRLLGGRSFRGTLVNRKKDGDLFWSEQTITPIRNASGENTHFVSLLSDVTEERARREQEFHLSMAAKIQRRFYDLPDTCEGLDFAATVHPAATIAGDHVDLLRCPDNEAWVVVGDVSGHGFGSALLIAETRAYMRAFANSERDLGRLLGMMNSALAADTDQASFVTMILVAIDHRRRGFRYASAGHVSGYLIHGSGEAVRTLESTDPPLGIFSNHRFSADDSGDLAAGDIFVLLSDGVTEAKPDGGWWVVDYVRSHIEWEAKMLVEGICAMARQHSGELRQTDDCAAVVCRVRH